MSVSPGVKTTKKDSKLTHSQTGGWSGFVLSLLVTMQLLKQANDSARRRNDSIPQFISKRLCEQIRSDHLLFVSAGLDNLRSWVSLQWVTEDIWKPRRLWVFGGNPQMLNWGQIPSYLSGSALLTPLLSEMPSFSVFFTPDIRSESLFHPSFYSPKANCSSETVVEPQEGGVGNAG